MDLFSGPSGVFLNFVYGPSGRFSDLCIWAIILICIALCIICFESLCMVSKMRGSIRFDL